MFLLWEDKFSVGLADLLGIVAGHVESKEAKACCSPS